MFRFNFVLIIPLSIYGIRKLPCVHFLHLAHRYITLGKHRIGAFHFLFPIACVTDLNSKLLIPPQHCSLFFSYCLQHWKTARSTLHKNPLKKILDEKKRQYSTVDTGFVSAKPILGWTEIAGAGAAREWLTCGGPGRASVLSQGNIAVFLHHHCHTATLDTRYQILDKYIHLHWAPDYDGRHGGAGRADPGER